MKKFRFYWINGYSNISSGKNAPDAFKRLGFGRSARSIMTHWEEIKED